MIAVVFSAKKQQKKGRAVKRVRHDTPVSVGHTRVKYSKSSTEGTQLHVVSHQVSGINATSNFH